jgi:hypothetical protein
MPQEILGDFRFARLEALILGEAETRVAALLADASHRAGLPGVMWRGPNGPVTASGPREHLAPNINGLPFIDRGFLADDPYRRVTVGLRPTWSEHVVVRTRVFIRQVVCRIPCCRIPAWSPGCQRSSSY